MDDIAIKFHNISKHYRFGQIVTGTLSHDLNRWFHMIRGKEDPYLKVGETNNRAEKGESDYVWALNNIDFEVKQGDIVGIIGKNGAGKSTLLKILSKVTKPTTGFITAKGRIASLLEVGTGFHFEMTGRENVYMNGSIMGMTKTEITRKFDEIVDFAGVERYIDTPVKRYSSGMIVRLGFAIAAHLEPEILVVDEVLAVGDAEFQKKAVGKMQEVSESKGRTVLFVSHNMSAVKNLCQRGIVMNNGQISFSGNIDKAVGEYIKDNENNFSTNLETEISRKGNGIVKFVEFFVTDANNRRVSSVETGSEVYLNFKIKALQKCKVDLGFSFFTQENNMLSVLYSSYQNFYANVDEGYSVISCKISDFSLCLEKIIVRGLIYVDSEIADWPKKHLGIINVEKSDYYGTGKMTDLKTQFLIKGKWSKSDVI